HGRQEQSHAPWGVEDATVKSGDWAGSVLLTDAQQRKTLAAIRSLARRRIAPHAGEVTIFATSLFSRHCAGRLVYPSPVLHPSEWMGSVEEYVKRHRIECLFPMDDDSLLLASTHREALQSRCALPLPPHEILVKGVDKAKTIAAAEGAGLRCPASLPVAEASGATEWHGGYPVLVRPRKSSGARGLRVVREPDELASTVASLAKEYPDGLLIQEYLPQGPKFDVCVLLDWSGKPIASFVQREIRCFPIPHGPSTVQESVKRPDLIELALRLLEHMGWTGLAEVEFMEDPRDGTPVFMEVNPRFWASLHLAVECGVDFPYLLYLLATGRDVPTRHEYPAGLKCRWLLPGDILHFVSNPQRLRMEPGFFESFRRDVMDDIMSLSDPGPTLGFILAAARYAFDPAMWRFMFRR
ncbi:MAG: ATP-grasp domain-containing protein, partial [Bacillota bacterium]